MKTPGSGARASPVNSLAHRKDCKQYHEPTAESLHNEFDLKEAVMISIAESIGLIQVANSDGVNPSGADSAALSTPNSPSLFGHRHAARGPAKSPFGGLSMLDISRSNSSSYGGLVGEEEVGSNQGTAQDSHFGAVEDLENDVQILYYKAGSVLVKEGEANAGLFFVIDGFLDITTTSTSETDSDFRKRASGDGDRSSCSKSSQVASQDTSRHSAAPSLTQRFGPRRIVTLDCYLTKALKRCWNADRLSC